MSELQHDALPLRVVSPVAVADPSRSVRHGWLHAHVLHTWGAWTAEGADGGAIALAEFVAIDTYTRQAFSVAAGALGVYERAHGRSLREHLAQLEQALDESGCPGPAAAREHARRTAAEAYVRDD